MNKKVENNVFISLTALSIIVAIYHFVGIFYKINDSSVWRHILFIVICIVCVYGLSKRPFWFIFFFFLLVLQQLYSHGSYLVWFWQNEHRIHWISATVVIAMPIIFTLLLLNRQGTNIKKIN